jgi:hypothetical protein
LSPFYKLFIYIFISPYPHRLCAQWGKLPCGAEPRIELGPALKQADALPTEPRRTIIVPFYFMQIYQVPTGRNFGHDTRKASIKNVCGQQTWKRATYCPF